MPDVRNTLGRYSDTLLRRVADSLVKPRNKLGAEELIDRCVVALENAAVIDRRVRDLPPGPRAVLCAVARSRQPVWKAGHLVTLAAAFGHADGFKTVEELLSAGLIFTADSVLPVSDFDVWFAAAGGLSAPCFVPPSVAVRASGVPLELPKLSGEAAPSAGIPGDGLDWPMRLAAVRQRVESDVVRMTRTGTLYKKDLSRFESDVVLSVNGLPDAGVLALFWALAAGLLARDGDSLVSVPFPPAWDGSIHGLVADLLGGFLAVESWDPLSGAVAENGTVPVGPTASLLFVLLLATVPTGHAADPQHIADWLWEHHPGFSSVIPPDSARNRGTSWVESLSKGIFEPLGIVERVGPRIRLAALGHHLLNSAPTPPEPAAFPQTLLVQPNAEILAYRQGLTPPLVATLSRFADWKVLGAACTLELTESRVYRGLESGLSVAEVLHPLQKNGSRPVPPAVEDLVRRWGSKRERVSVYSSATLVEFQSAAELDQAISRGVVAIKLTDRIGLTADGRDPDYAALRLVGNRDYEARPQPCVRVADDGITWTVDAALADLLLDAELARLSDAVPDDSPVPRRVRANAEKLRLAAERGLTRDELDQWFVIRTGGPTPPAVLLFAFGPTTAGLRTSREVVIRMATVELTDGIWQWPSTRALLAERLGPTALVVSSENYELLIERLAEIGIVAEVNREMKPAG